MWSNSSKMTQGVSGSQGANRGVGFNPEALLPLLWGLLHRLAVPTTLHLNRLLLLNYLQMEPGSGSGEEQKKSKVFLMKPLLCSKVPGSSLGFVDFMSFFSLSSVTVIRCHLELVRHVCDWKRTFRSERDALERQERDRTGCWERIEMKPFSLETRSRGVAQAGLRNPCLKHCAWN